MPKIFKCDAKNNLEVTDTGMQWSMSAEQAAKHEPQFKTEMTFTEQQKINDIKIALTKVVL